MAKKVAPDSPLGRLSARFRQARLDACMSQDQLHEATGIAKSFISGFENGKRNISIAKLDCLASALGLEIAIDLRPPN